MYRNHRSEPWNSVILKQLLKGAMRVGLSTDNHNTTQAPAEWWHCEQLQGELWSGTA